MRICERSSWGFWDLVGKGYELDAYCGVCGGHVMHLRAHRFHSTRHVHGIWPFVLSYQLKAISNTFCNQTLPSIPLQSASPSAKQPYPTPTLAPAYSQHPPPHPHSSPQNSSSAPPSHPAPHSHSNASS